MSLPIVFSPDAASRTSLSHAVPSPTPSQAPSPHTSASCCGGSKPSMSDYIDRGLRRRRRAPLPIAGVAQYDDEGRVARFSLNLERGIVTDVTFEASVCVTLVAYCEVLCHWVTGLTLRAAALQVYPRALASELSLVPAIKRDRALLASRALTAALVAAAREKRE